jgi:hypothetical protein
MGFFSGRPFCRGGDLMAAEWCSDFAGDLFPLYSNRTELILVGPAISFYNPEYEDREELLKQRVRMMEHVLKATGEAAATMDSVPRTSDHRELKFSDWWSSPVVTVMTIKQFRDRFA